MAGLAVKYFMWPYQPHFQLSAKSSAERLFASLLDTAAPDFILVGIRVEDRDDRDPICVEPDHGDIQPEHFVPLADHVRSAKEANPRSGMFISNPHAAKRVQAALNDDSLAKAIEICCADAPGQTSRIFFAAAPVRIDCFDVVPVLSLDRGAYDAQAFLEGDVIDRIPVERSLVDAVAGEFLRASRLALREPDAGVNLAVIPASTEELLKRGGQRFLKSTAWRAFGIDALVNVETLCDAMTNVSAALYEGHTALGGFVLCNASAIPPHISLRTAVPLKETRRVRKLLELSRDTLRLVLSDSGVSGLAKRADDQTADLFEVDITAHQTWRIVHSNRVLCEFRNGVPGLPRARVTRDDLSELCDRSFGQTVNVDSLWDIVCACIDQRRGTTVVISTRADREAERLGSQSTLIIPKQLAQEDVSALTAIDGALLIDIQGQCHAIGVILDGIAISGGDPGRGARYNSALRYLAAHGAECIICLVSEDGDVSLLPKLRPRVERSWIDARIAQLVASAANADTRPRVYGGSRTAVEEIAFYLSQSQCDRANSAIDDAEAKLDAAGRTVWIHRPRLAPHPDMNESYFTK